MFGTSGVSHEWDALAFGLSAIPVVATLLLVLAAYWEQWRRGPAMRPGRRSDGSRIAGPGPLARISASISALSL
jgi:hypothetical protein